MSSVKAWQRQTMWILPGQPLPSFQVIYYVLTEVCLKKAWVRLMSELHFYRYLYWTRLEFCRYSCYTISEKHTTCTYSITTCNMYVVISFRQNFKKSKTPISIFLLSRIVCDSVPDWENRKKIYHGIRVFCFQCVCLVSKYMYIKVSNSFY